MARLFNLESYPKLCTNTNLYEYKTQTEYKTQINSSVAYKSFLDNYKELGYRNDSNYSQELTITEESIPLKHLGINLTEGSDNLYIISDRVDSLSLKNFLKQGERYIYRSVYHYWNYRQQIANNLDLDSSVVFIDLNSLSDEPYCSLQFIKRLPTDYYFTPIIDNRSEVNTDFKPTLDIKKLHDNIYRNLAQAIISHNFPQLATDNNSIKHLKSYLQKIEIFKIAQSQSDLGEFSVVVEILARDKIYYKSVRLAIELLENIVIEEIDVETIAKFTQNYLQQSFVLISDYNFLPKFRKALDSSNVFIPDDRLQEFPQIWEEKQQYNFPLFGQYLDKIKFQIKRQGKLEWIEVLSKNQQEHIYYEGDSKAKRFIARIQETGQDYFKLKNSSTILPIKINDRDYCVDGITQEYIIIHPLSESKAELKELEVRIEFVVKLGSIPKLRVTDKENKYNIESELRNCQENITLLDYIPIETILDRRRQKNCFVPSLEKLDLLGNILLSIKNINTIKDAMKFKNEIDRAYDMVNGDKSTDLFLNLDLENSAVKAIKEKIYIFNNSGLVNEIISYLKGNYNFNKEKTAEANRFVKKSLMFIGKLYKLSSGINLKLFFDATVIESACKTKGIKDQYFLFLSRTALTPELQLTYFSFFYKNWFDNRSLYQIEQYLWGYSRILLWYFEFKIQDRFYFKNHFISILNYLQTNSKLNYGYKQNAFLTSIYLLTFRDPLFKHKFCAPNSDEYKLAKEIAEQYKSVSKSVKLKAVSNAKPLNKYFEELLEGNSSQKILEDLITLDR